MECIRISFGSIPFVLLFFRENLDRRKIMVVGFLLDSFRSGRASRIGIHTHSA